MIPDISILGHSISIYGIMIVVGILAVVVYFNVKKKKFTAPEADVQLAIIYSGIGAFFGAKILYILTVLPDFVSDISYLKSSPATFIETYLSGGFVFYGGVYGALLTAFIYCRIVHLSWWDMASCAFPVIPLFHMFGRIGCFLVGCCYGIESSFGIIYTHSDIAPNNVTLLPVQLFEAIAELILFIILMIIANQKNAGMKMSVIWLLGYGVLRFVLEFFRGDSYRGFIGIFSTSQICALVSICFGLIILVRFLILRGSPKNSPNIK